MGQIFMTAANAVLPIVLLILLGYVLKRRGWLPEAFLTTGNKLVFAVCLPATMFVNVYSIGSFQALHWDVIGYCVVMVLLLFLLGLATAMASTKQINRRGVMVQCVFRSNFAIIGLPLAAAVGGVEAEAVAAVISAFVVPVFNILAVISLEMFNNGEKGHQLRGVLLGIAKNPMILGVLAGFAALLLRHVQVLAWGEAIFTVEEQLPFAYKVLTQLKNCTTPLALIVMGGQFEFSAAKGMLKEIMVGTAWRIVLAPLLGVGVAVLLSQTTEVFSFGPNTYPALVALFGSPVAVSSAVMARQMGGDGQLATQYVVWSSILSVVTVFLLISGMLAMGLLVV